MEYLNDVRVYDVLNQSWHGVKKPSRSDIPAEQSGPEENGMEEKELGAINLTFFVPKI